MPPLEHMDLTTKALYWAKVSVSRHGQAKVDPDSRVEIKTRWVHKRRDVLRPDGSTMRIDVTIATNVDIPLGSIVWEGSLLDLDGNTTGTGTGTSTEVPHTDLMQVVSASRATDLKGRVTRYEYGLMRYGNNIPLTS